MYRYLAADTITGRILGDLELSGVTWETGLMSSGGVDAAVVLSDIVDHPEHAHALRENTTPYRTTVLVMRDAEPIVEAMWLPRQVTDEGAVLKLHGPRLWNLLLKSRYIDVDRPKVFTQTDQADIVTWLLNHAVDRPGGGLNLTINCPPTGVLRDATYEPGGNVTVGQAIETLAEGAFDFDLTSRLDGHGGIAREFRMFYPAQGGINPDLSFRAGGNLTTWTVDETDVENVTTVDGATLSETYVRGDMLDLGWPRIENRVAAKDLTDRADVVALAEARSVLFGSLNESPSVTVAGYGGWKPGEVAAVQFDRNPWRPEGFATWARIASTRCTVSDEGNETCTVRFADRFAALPPKSEPEATGRALAELNRRLRNLE